MKLHIRRYLDALEDDQWRRYRVVRSSPKNPRRAPFGEWRRNLKCERDVLLDFSTQDPIRIYLNRHYLDPGASARGWYFTDKQGRKIRCCSGYEALFVAYLKWSGLPFEYQKWILAGGHADRRALQKRKSQVFNFLMSRGIPFHRSTAWAEIKKQESGFMYIPDFYLPATDEFVELKGWPSYPQQVRAIRRLRRVGYRITVLEWEDLRRLLGLPFLSYNTCIYRTKELGSKPATAFANPYWVKERLCAVPVRLWHARAIKKRRCPSFNGQYVVSGSKSRKSR